MTELILTFQTDVTIIDSIIDTDFKDAEKSK